MCQQTLSVEVKIEKAWARGSRGLHLRQLQELGSHPVSAFLTRRKASTWEARPVSAALSDQREPSFFPTDEVAWDPACIHACEGLCVILLSPAPTGPCLWGVERWSPSLSLTGSVLCTWCHLSVSPGSSHLYGGLRVLWPMWGKCPDLHKCTLEENHSFSSMARTWSAHRIGAYV